MTTVARTLVTGFVCLALVASATMAETGATTEAATEAADDYTPVRCQAAVAYGGSLHAAQTLPDVSGALSGAFDAPTIAKFDAAIARAQSAGNVSSMTAAVAIPGRALWTREGTAQPAPLHFWASAGKTFVAVTILQLVDEGKLSLSDAVSRWIKDVPNGDSVTIEHLLAHTSGLFSANEDLKVREARRYHTPAENLKVAAKHGAMFCPGERWRYSNTGYDLLGEIIQKVDGRPYPDAIAARIITPLKLTRLRVLTPTDPLKDVAPLVSSKEQAMDPRWAGAAGPMVGSAEDMIRFWQALLANQLLKPDTTRKMFERLYPMFTPIEFYGLGVMLFDVPEANGSKTVWLGHAGGGLGSGALVAYSPSDRAFVAVALTGDGSAPATANLLLRQLRQ